MEEKVAGKKRRQEGAVVEAKDKQMSWKEEQEVQWELE
jgi:hypothetical protein